MVLSIEPFMLYWLCSSRCFNLTSTEDHAHYHLQCCSPLRLRSFACRVVVSRPSCFVFFVVFCVAQRPFSTTGRCLQQRQLSKHFPMQLKWPLGSIAWAASQNISSFFSSWTSIPFFQYHGQCELLDWVCKSMYKRTYINLMSNVVCLYFTPVK